MYNSRALLLGTLTFMAARVWAQQPPDSVASDSYNNTAMGLRALLSQTAGQGSGAAHDNTAAGASTLTFNTIGYANTAVGSNALTHNSDGAYNTATGYGAMFSNTAGEQNAAYGSSALNANTTGSENAAFGDHSLTANTNGVENSAFGGEALGSNTIGNQNTAVGYFALPHNTTGGSNTATGSGALASNTTGNDDTADGADALGLNLVGTGNTALGTQALFNNQTGSNNLALGFSAGFAITDSNNIDIANPGVAKDNGVVRIGTAANQKTVFIAGIAAKKITGSAVYITAGGELGVLASSERYKTAIASMDDATAKLRRLRPVTFHLKSEPNGTLQYGLIAEEVAKVYPELVTRDEAGVIQGVRYDELAPMLLNEMQIQTAQAERQFLRLRQQGAELQRQAARLSDDAALRTTMLRELMELKRQNQATQAMLQQVLDKGPSVAMR